VNRAFVSGHELHGQTDGENHADEAEWGREENLVELWKQKPHRSGEPQR